MPTVRVSQMMIKSPEAASAFVFTVQTTGAEETFAMPLESGGTYAFHIEWGDSSSDDIAAWDAAAKTHTYSSAGTYEISITGTLYGFNFSTGGDKLKIYEIKSFGAVRLGNNWSQFKDCSNLTITATDVLDLTGLNTAQNMFANCTSLTTAPSMNSWDVSGITNFYSMFYGAALFNQNIGSWDVSNATDISGMFEDAAAFNQDISNWNVSSVLDFRYAFEGATSFDQDLSDWNVTAATHMARMFYEITLSVANYDALLVGWEAQSVKNNVIFSGGNSKYSAGAAATAKQALIDDHSWVITDGGVI